MVRDVCIFYGCSNFGTLYALAAMEIQGIAEDGKTNSSNTRDAFNQSQTLEKNRRPVSADKLTHSCRRPQTHRYPADRSQFSW